MSTIPQQPQIIYDRALIQLPNGEYLPNGFVRNFYMDFHAQNSQQFGLNQTGTAVAQTWGNSALNIRWDEWIGNASQWFNWQAFVKATPNIIITVIPFSLNENAPIAPNFTILGLLPISSGIHFGGDSQPGMRPCAFTAASSSLLSY